MSDNQKFEPGDVVRQTDGPKRDYIVTGYTRPGLVDARPVHGKQSTVSRPEGGWEMVTPLVVEPPAASMPRLKRIYEYADDMIKKTVSECALPPGLLGPEVRNEGVGDD